MFHRKTLFPKLTFALTLVALLVPMAIAQSDGQRIVVPLSEPNRPVRLHVDIFSGEIEVVGYDGDEIVVVASTPTRKMSTDPGNGMKRIPNTSIGLTIEEHDNRVTVNGEWHDRAVHVKLQVPHETSAVVSSVNRGDVIIRGLVGEHELQNTNGGIRALDVSGSVVANTTNGDVEVRFVELTRDKSMAFTTLNGDVDVSFPAGLRADLRISPGRGEILTDFDVEVQPGEPTVKRGQSGGGYRVEMDNDVHATVGGGGVTYRFKTFNGDIYIRKSSN